MKKLQDELAESHLSAESLAENQLELEKVAREKLALEEKLVEAENNKTIIQNITYNLQDSVISGDINNKINDDK